MNNNQILEDFEETFPDAWGKPGQDFDGGTAIIWSGEGADLEDGTPCFNYNATEFDPSEKMYTMGVANELVAWADKHGCFWECHDPGTYMLYEN